MGIFLQLLSILFLLLNWGVGGGCQCSVHGGQWRASAPLTHALTQPSLWPSTLCFEAGSPTLRKVPETSLSVTFLPSFQHWGYRCVFLYLWLLGSELSSSAVYQLSRLPSPIKRLQSYKAFYNLKCMLFETMDWRDDSELRKACLANLTNWAWFPSSTVEVDNQLPRVTFWQIHCAPYPHTVIQVK